MIKLDMDFCIEVVVWCSGMIAARTSCFCAWLCAGSILEHEICLAKDELDILGLDIEDNFECRLNFSPPNDVQAPVANGQSQNGIQSHQTEDGFSVKVISKNAQLYCARLTVHESNQVSLRMLHSSDSEIDTGGWWRFLALSLSFSSSQASSKSSTFGDMDTLFCTASSSTTSSEESSRFLWSSSESRQYAEGDIVFHIAQVKRITRDNQDKIVLEFRNGKKLCMTTLNAFSVMTELSRAAHDVDQTQFKRMGILNNILHRTFANLHQSRRENIAHAITGSLGHIWRTVFPDKETPALDAPEWLSFGSRLHVADAQFPNVYVEPVALELFAYYSTQYGYAVRRIVRQQDHWWLGYKVFDFAVLITRMLFLRLGIRELYRGVRLNEWAQHPSELLLCLSTLNEDKGVLDDCNSRRLLDNNVEASIPLCEVSYYTPERLH